MTQHLGSLSPKRISEEQCLSPEQLKSIDRVRMRELFDVGRWDQLSWYVKFSTADFSNLSKENLQNIQYEICALCNVIDGNFNGKPLYSLKKLKALHQKFSTHLANLVDHGQTDFGLSTSRVVAYRLYINIVKGGKFVPRSGEPLTDKGLLIPQVFFKKTFPHCKTPEALIRMILLNHLKKLIGEFGHMISRCLKCQKIFLQNRRHAKCCSRQCQSQRAMQVLRQREKASKIKEKIHPQRRLNFLTKSK